jgi:hypothetical protein
MDWSLRDSEYVFISTVRNTSNRSAGGSPWDAKWREVLECFDASVVDRILQDSFKERLWRLEPYLWVDPSKRGRKNVTRGRSAGAEVQI